MTSGFKCGEIFRGTMVPGRFTKLAAGTDGEAFMDIHTNIHKCSTADKSPAFSPLEVKYCK